MKYKKSQSIKENKILFCISFCIFLLRITGKLINFLVTFFDIFLTIINFCPKQICSRRGGEGVKERKAKNKCKNLLSAQFLKDKSIEVQFYNSE